MIVRVERGEEAILRWWCSQPGTSGCEEICLSGGLVGQKVKYLRFLRKRMNTMSCKGSIHFRVLARILWRTVQGILRLQPGDKFNLVGHLSTEVGWHHYDTIKELQGKQKAKSKVFYECKKHLIQFHLKAAKCVEEQISPLQETLVRISYKA